MSSSMAEFEMLPLGRGGESDLEEIRGRGRVHAPSFLVVAAGSGTPSHRGNPGGRGNSANNHATVFRPDWGVTGIGMGCLEQVRGVARIWRPWPLLHLTGWGAVGANPLGAVHAQHRHERQPSNRRHRVTRSAGGLANFSESARIASERLCRTRHDRCLAKCRRPATAARCTTATIWPAARRRTRIRMGV